MFCIQLLPTQLLNASGTRGIIWGNSATSRHV